MTHFSIDLSSCMCVCDIELSIKQTCILYVRSIPSPMTSSIDCVSTLLCYRNAKTNVIDHETRSVSLRELNVQCPYIDQTMYTIHLFMDFRVRRDKISDAESELELSISTRLPKIKIDGEITTGLVLMIKLNLCTQTTSVP